MSTSFSDDRLSVTPDKTGWTTQDYEDYYGGLACDERREARTNTTLGQFEPYEERALQREREIEGHQDDPVWHR